MKKFDRVIMSLLSLIAGVSLAGCGGGGGGTSGETYEPGDMYAPPMYAPTFEDTKPRVTISGKVTQSNGTPIENIVITSKWGDNVSVDRTDANGTYIVGSSMNGDSVKIEATDMDGSDHGGEFATQTIDLGAIDDSRQDVDIVLQTKSDSKE